MEPGLSEKVALATGENAGIGAAIAWQDGFASKFPRRNSMAMSG